MIGIWDSVRSAALVPCGALDFVDEKKEGKKVNKKLEELLRVVQETRREEFEALVQRVEKQELAKMDELKGILIGYYIGSSSYKQ
jgi:hypothetical protein